MGRLEEKIASELLYWLHSFPFGPLNIFLKAEWIGGEREGDFMNNFIKWFFLKDYELRVLKLEE
jgi:hypothetical protein